MSVIEMNVGSQVWFEGELWQIVDLSARTATLSSGSTRRRVLLNHLAASARVVTEESTVQPDQDAGLELGNVVLSSLTQQQRAQLERRAAALQAIENPDARLATDRADRVAAAATELGVSKRTVQRWLTSYREAGIAGLADSRLLGLRSASRFAMGRGLSRGAR